MLDFDALSNLIKLDFYDAEAVRQGRTSDEDATTYRGGAYVDGETDNGTMGKRQVTGNRRVKMPDGRAIRGRSTYGRHTLGEEVPEEARREDKQRGHSRRHDGFNDLWDAMSREEQTGSGRYLRGWEPAPAQVWEIATKPFRESHFATFPPELVERCIKAGCPPGMPILDPFGGSGTTALVADAYGYDCTLIELNPEYVALARRRLASGLVRMDRPAEPHAAHDGLFKLAGE